ncbi:F-box only protein 47-like isoform X2 [Myripristis murdjan]|uniref:F-box only protein 47-like isoform X2 n=1 Tax=Myripristis murdjan TaxID=586833 RepID=UPI001176424D|nr:F-box only protein 47 isoform X2 [Myripristis murdjan]
MTQLAMALTARMRKSQLYRRCRRPYPVRTVTTRSQSTASSCFIQRLPPEVLDMILDRLSVLEISVFSMVSKVISSYTMDYISTLAWKNKMITKSFHYITRMSDQCSIIAHYKALGLLFKRCTLLLPTKDRLKFIFSKFSQVPCFMLEQCTTADCIGFSCYGVFLQTLIAGWDELECNRVFSFLCNLTNLPRKIEAVVAGKPGVSWYQELQLRLFCRRVLLDPWPQSQDSAFWLTQILKPWPMVSQARLLFIFYGPLLPDSTLGWQDLVGRELPHCALWDLARAILVLHSNLEVQDWTTNTMVSILEELTVIPQMWHVENVARLLVLCGSSLCYSVLASKAVNGRLHEISKVIVYIILVCEKDGFHMNWAAKIVLKLCQIFKTTAEKFLFIHTVEDMLSEITMELYELATVGDHLEHREIFQTLCLLLHSSTHFHSKMFQLLLRK